MFPAGIMVKTWQSSGSYFVKFSIEIEHKLSASASVQFTNLSMQKWSNLQFK